MRIHQCRFDSVCPQNRQGTGKCSRQRHPSMCHHLNMEMMHNHLCLLYNLYPRSLLHTNTDMNREYFCMWLRYGMAMRVHIHWYLDHTIVQCIQVGNCTRNLDNLNWAYIWRHCGNDLAGMDPIYSRNFGQYRESCKHICSHLLNQYKIHRCDMDLSHNRQYSFHNCCPCSPAYSCMCMNSDHQYIFHHAGTDLRDEIIWNLNCIQSWI